MAKWQEHLISDSDKPDAGVWFLNDGEIARWDASILAWKVTGDRGFEPNWKNVVMQHGHFEFALSLDYA